jgi:hypothetical protein
MMGGGGGRANRSEAKKRRINLRGSRGPVRLSVGVGEEEGGESWKVEEGDVDGEGVGWELGRVSRGSRC